MGVEREPNALQYHNDMNNFGYNHKKRNGFAIQAALHANKRKGAAHGQTERA